jgi:hypothetical protein
VGRSAPGSNIVGFPMALASPLASLCARRCFFCRGMNFRMSLSEVRWRGDKRVRGAWPHGARLPFPATPRVDARKSSVTDTDPSFSTYSILSFLPGLSHVLRVFQPLSMLGILQPVETHSSCRELSKSINQHISVGMVSVSDVWLVESRRRLVKKNDSRTGLRALVLWSIIDRAGQNPTESFLH